MSATHRYVGYALASEKAFYVSYAQSLRFILGVHGRKRGRHVSTELAPINAAKASSHEEAGLTRRIVEFDSAIARNEASFGQLAESVFYSRVKFNADPLDRAVRERYIAPLTEAFEKAHGAITHSYYCQEIIAAVVLTGRQELWLISPSVDSSIPIAELLFECDRLNVESDRVLGGPERTRELQTTKMLIYSVISKLLALADSPTKPSSGIVDLHKREVRHAREYYLRAAARYAQFDYFLGMLGGIAIGLGLMAISTAAWSRFGPDLDGNGKTLLGCLTAGGFGAVVSVLSRMTFGALSVDYEAGRRLLMMLGAFRPIIGMVLGAAMWVLAASGVLAIGPIDKTRMPFFYILIGFLAGFSERWAQDMLGRTADQISRPGATGRGRRSDGERNIGVSADAHGGT